MVMPAVANLIENFFMLMIIGCGNLNRSDDGVGVIVARRLIDWVNARGISNVSVFDAGTAGMEVMFRARGAKRLILVDASRSGSEPGAIFRVPGAELEQAHEPTYSLHDFRWDHALYAGRRIFGADFPADVTVFLIEAGELGLGLELSEPVRRASDRLVADIQAMIESHASRARA
jgi:hydrogenase maturation protease